MTSQHNEIQAEPRGPAGAAGATAAAGDEREFGKDVGQQPAMSTTSPTPTYSCAVCEPFPGDP